MNKEEKETEELTFPCGSCVVRELDSDELKEQEFYAKYRMVKFDNKIVEETEVLKSRFRDTRQLETEIERMEDAVTRQKLKEATRLYNEGLATSINSHTFILQGGQTLAQYIGKAKPELRDMIEKTIDKLSSFTKEEALDLPQPSETESSPASQETEPSSESSTSSEGTDSGGV